MNNPLSIIADVAAEDLNKHEVTTNRAPWITKFWEENNYSDGEKNREPYCMAAVAYWIREADGRSPLLELPKPPKMAAVRQFDAWAASVGALAFGPDSENYSPRRGDIVSFLPSLSHIGVVAGNKFLFNGEIVVPCIESNTNDAGGREGDGCYEKKRRLGFCGTFYRIPARALAV